MKLELTLSPEYVQNWDAWAAIRELLQNAADANDIGMPMSVHRTTAGMIKIHNKGADLDRSTLLMGTTSKLNRTDQRGKFGEGYKLALLVLARMGIEVVCHTQEETWTPDLSYSEKFGATVLTIDIRRVKKRRDGLTFVVKGVSDGDWQCIRERCLFLKKPKESEMIRTRNGLILKGEKYKGLLFSRGLFVGKLPDVYHTGFDLSNVELDRDRRLADPWSLKWEISAVLREAQSGADALALLTSDTGEANALENYYAYRSGDSFTEKIAAAFLEKHGADAMPVASMAEAIEAQHMGLKGIVLPKAAVSILGKSLGDFQEKKQQRAFSPREFYSPSDLTAEEFANFNWAYELVASLEHADLEDVDFQVVDFFSDSVWGTFQRDRGTVVIRIARKRLLDRAELIGTVVHELAHTKGGDGTQEHVQAIQAIFAELVVKNTERSRTCLQQFKSDGAIRTGSLVTPTFIPTTSSRPKL